MKAKTFLINQSIQTHYKCEKRSFTLSFSWQWLRVLGRSMRAQMNRWSRQYVHAELGVRAGLVALLLALTTRINRRILLGLGLMGVVAPASACIYMLFDRTAFTQGWYLVNYFHLFLTIAPYLFIMACLIGVWFLFPQGSKRAYALTVPSGYTLGKILWLLQCTSNDDFYSVVPLSFIGLGALLSVFFFVAFDWLVHNKFHGEDKHQVSFETLYNGADLVSDKEFKRMFKSAMEAKKEFQSKY